MNPLENQNNHVLGVCKGNFPSKEEVVVPGSKYLANRFLVAAALAEGRSALKNMPQNRDLDEAIKGLRAFGVGFEWQHPKTLLVRGVGGKPKTPQATVDTGNNGTFSRFVLPFASLCSGDVFVRSGSQMKRRPMGELLQALNKLGVAMEAKNNSFPLRIGGTKTPAQDTLEVGADSSSQFASALVLCGPYLAPKKSPLKILLRSKNPDNPLVSQQYLDMTIEVARRFGARIERPAPNEVFVWAGEYKPISAFLEGDMVSASYFIGMAMLGGKKLRISGVRPSGPYGENRCHQLFQSMGCPIVVEDNALVVEADANTKLKAIDVDASTWTDSCITIAFCCAVADGRSQVKNLSHLRLKESNRLEAIASALTLFGVRVDAVGDDLVIVGQKPPLSSASLSANDDHRIAMAASMLCLVSPKVTIRGSRCVQKSFPYFWDFLASLGFDVTAET